MSYKEIDFGSYEAPNARILAVVNEDIICGSKDGIPDIDGDDVVDDGSGWN